MNPTNGDDLTRFARVRKHDFKKMEPYRKHRRERWLAYLGSHYSDDGVKKERPVNLMKMAADTWTMHLVARAPAAMIETDYDDLESHADDLEHGLNILIGKKMHLEFELQRVVKDALFGMGILKVGLNRSHGVQLGGEWCDVGQVFAKAVDLDDFVWDMSVADKSQVQYVGHRYRMTMDDMRKSGMFDPEKLDELAYHPPSATNTGGDTKLKNVAGTVTAQDDLFEKHYELWDIYLPKTRQMITVPDRQDDLQLRPDDQLDWQGPEGGPYHVLGLGDVAGNLMPLCPLASLQSLDEFANKLYRKLMRQAERQRTHIVYRKGDEDDANTVQDGDDGDGLALTHPEGVKEVRFGGPDQANLAMFLQNYKMFNLFGGNVESLRGLQAQADTLGQEELLSAAAQKTVADMQKSTMAFAKGIVRDIAWYLFHDPFIQLPYTKREQGVSERFVYSASTVEGDYFDYGFDIAPHSMQAKSPQMVLQVIRLVLTEFVGPFYPDLQSQGIVIDWPKLLAKVGKLTNVDVDDLLIFGGQPAAQGQPPGDAPQKAQFSHHVNTRRNVSGGSSESPAQVASQMGVGGESEIAGMFTASGQGAR